MSIYLLVVSYVAMVVAGFAVGVAFNLLGWTPKHFHVSALQAAPSWNYTSVLDLAFILLMAVMFYRFLRTGGPEMIRAMAVPGGGGHAGHGHDHEGHEGHEGHGGHGHSAP
ncbi:MAG TPA: hypothetical protein VET26_07435 [Candidatus Sulfotelmatobacter sp.]|nr:hypothetical protein [Candidatus Sulfotelmatobacter sp.]